MTDKPDNSVVTDFDSLDMTSRTGRVLQLAEERTHLAAERTDFALIRTGFSTASFGAGLTQIIGRGIWPQIAVDLLTLVFILAGVFSIQIGLVRLQRRFKLSEPRDAHEKLTRALLVPGLFLLQFALIMIVIMVLMHM